MSHTKWEGRFYTLANTVADWSKDPHKKCGVVIISPDKKEISYGYNGFPTGIADDERLEQKETKNELMLHAEMNAILNAKKDLTGWTLYCSQSICTQCALAIIQANISRVVMPRIQLHSTWYLSCTNAVKLFTEANVIIHYINENEYYV